MDEPIPRSWKLLQRYWFFCVFFFLYQKRIASDKISLWQVITAVGFRNDFSHSLFVNWIEISCGGLGKRQPRIDVETDSWRRRHCHLSCSRLFSTNVMVLWCQRQMDIAHSLRRVLFSVARRTHRENISSWHSLVLVDKVNNKRQIDITLKKYWFKIEILLGITFGFIMTLMSYIKLCYKLNYETGEEIWNFRVFPWDVRSRCRLYKMFQNH